MKRSTEAQIQGCIDRYDNVQGKMSINKLEQLMSLQIKVGHLAAYLNNAIECEREHERELKRAHEEHYYDGLIELAAEAIRAMERITE